MQENEQTSQYSEIHVEFRDVLLLPKDSVAAGFSLAILSLQECSGHIVIPYEGGFC